MNAVSNISTMRKATLTHYRAYRLTPDLKIAGLPAELNCLNDADALRSAEFIAESNECSVEVWHGGRMVALVNRQAADHDGT